MIKKILGFAAGAGMLLATITPAFAAVGCSNVRTGSTSNNVCNTVLSKVKTLSLSNTGSVNHSVTKNAVSGYNTANNNTSIGSPWAINAGGAVANVESHGLLNTGDLTVTQTDPAADHKGANDTTGFASNNTVGVTNAKTVGLSIGNTGSVGHTLNVNAWSGYNTANNNTIAGGIQTGTASSNSLVTSIMNDLILDVAQ